VRRRGVAAGILVPRTHKIAAEIVGPVKDIVGLIRR
jgi:hypothetical protein